MQIQVAELVKEYMGFNLWISSCMYYFSLINMKNSSRDGFESRLCTVPRMAEACNVTARAGASHSRGFEDAVNARIAGELQGEHRA
jgi:hypothetical protein